jgi:hypothetical protein
LQLAQELMVSVMVMVMFHSVLWLIVAGRYHQSLFARWVRQIGETKKYPGG